MPGSDRFYESPPWRFVVTNRDSEILTFLDRLASNRGVTRTLNAPLMIEGSVPSDNPEVFLEVGGTGPFVGEGNRLLYAFRRESETAPKWICRGAGIILFVDDQGGPDFSRTTFRAFDPWAYLYSRPCRDPVGDLPGEGGLDWYAADGDTAADIAQDLAVRTIVADGPIFCNVGSGTGTFEATEPIDFHIQQGMSVGEAWDQLVDTGTVDIVLDPIYDPAQPGIVAQMNCYESYGSPRYGSIFAWDKPSRSVVQMGRSIDGRERANKIQYYIGQGGPPVPLVTGADGVTDFGEYWEQQFFPGQDAAAAVLAKAEAQMRLRSRGLTLYSISPAPERAPIPFIDYDIGDLIPLYASSRLRQSVADMKRVHSIPLVMSDDQMEAPANVLLADEEELGS